MAIPDLSALVKMSPRNLAIEVERVEMHLTNRIHRRLRRGMPAGDEARVLDAFKALRLKLLLPVVNQADALAVG